MAAATPTAGTGAAPYETPGSDKLTVTNAQLCARWGLEERQVPIKGRGVFATAPIPAGELVIKFEGPVYTRATMAAEKDFSEAIQVRARLRPPSPPSLCPSAQCSSPPFPPAPFAFPGPLQGGVDGWMWSSGGLDDLVNHSCNPSLGLWQRGGDTFLWSVRAIAVGEELSFDYSTSMMDEPWDMECACGEAACRGIVGNALDMHLGTLQYYAGMGLLPEHVWAAAAERGVAIAKGESPTAEKPSQGAPVLPKVVKRSATE